MTSGEEPKPSELRGGAQTGDDEAQEKGAWAGYEREGVVPPELGGSDALPEQLAEDSDLDDAVLGGRARSDGPATESGIDRHAGDRADATTDGAPAVPEGAEPDLKDAGRGPRRVDVEAAE